MPENAILILEHDSGNWRKFLVDYFADVPVVVRTVSQLTQGAVLMDRILPQVMFAEPAFLNRSFLQKVRVRKNTDPSFRSYLLGVDALKYKDISFDGIFPVIPSVAEFNKRFVDTLPMPETIRLLVVDDEEEIGALVRDYFEGRKDPAFEIDCVPNGAKALAVLAHQKPHVIVLDIKMPVMDGREFYAKFKERKQDIPVIVFFDSVSGEELMEIRKFGNPSVLEKGCQGSSLHALMMLVKKLVYFS